MKKLGKSGSVSVGKLANRWGVSVDRIRSLIQKGLLEAFEIPSSGRFGQTIRISVRAVRQAELHWRLEACQERLTRQRVRNTKNAVLRHFPDLKTSPVLDAEYPASDQRSSERTVESIGCSYDPSTLLTPDR